MYFEFVWRKNVKNMFPPGINSAFQESKSHPQHMWRRSACCQEKINKGQKVAYFRAFCEVSIIREALRKARFSYMEIYLL